LPTFDTAFGKIFRGRLFMDGFFADTRTEKLHDIFLGRQLTEESALLPTQCLRQAGQQCVLKVRGFSLILSRATGRRLLCPARTQAPARCAQAIKDDWGSKQSNTDSEK
jgi:hypothetical protein